SSFLQYWVTSYAPELGMGTSNYGRYSNPELDKIFRQAVTTVDDAQREKLLQQALTIALDDLPSIPLHYESTLWAFRKGLTYEGRADQYALATSVKPPPSRRLLLQDPKELATWFCSPCAGCFRACS